MGRLPKSPILESEKPPPAINCKKFGTARSVNAAKNPESIKKPSSDFRQIKGTLYNNGTDVDEISSVEFNNDGELLATGDTGGRLVIYKRDLGSKSVKYNVYLTFKSHEREFDFLKSFEIEESIKKIRWLHRTNAAHFLLSTNDKTVKLWKVSEHNKSFEKEKKNDLRKYLQHFALRVSSVKQRPLKGVASTRRIFANAHNNDINSISVNSDQETYLSADDLGINLWHLEVTNESFNIVDIRPRSMDELSEVITVAEFHPTACNLFLYGSSKGIIRLCDMRASALCDNHSKQFETQGISGIRSISDVKISNSGRYMMSRDYLSVKVWDLNMETSPIETYPVHEYLNPQLWSLYENDYIFDNFECSWNANNTSILTGSYNNFCRIFDRNSKTDITFEASRTSIKKKTKLKPQKVYIEGKPKMDEIIGDRLNLNKKILHTAWHPQETVIAVAAQNNLFIFKDMF